MRRSEWPSQPWIDLIGAPREAPIQVGDRAASPVSHTEGSTASQEIRPRQTRWCRNMGHDRRDRERRHARGRQRPACPPARGEAAASSDSAVVRLAAGARGASRRSGRAQADPRHRWSGLRQDHAPRGESPGAWLGLVHGRPRGRVRDRPRARARGGDQPGWRARGHGSAGCGPAGRGDRRVARGGDRLRPRRCR